MTYLINEIFHSVKGEGKWVGIPMNFIRFATCNLTCDHCDTTFNKSIIRMEVVDIIGALQRHVQYVVLTGGEPTLQQLDPLIVALTANSYLCHLETNGTFPLPANKIDWICVSPKLEFGEPLKDNVLMADEIKMPIRGIDDIKRAEEFRAKYPHARGLWYLHPWNDHFQQVHHGVELGEGARSIKGLQLNVNRMCAEYASRAGNWGVSVQAHKIWGVR